jgi:phosphatidylglycerophosphate synthase
LDCLDGDLARYSGRSSAFGAALDPILDRTGEFLYLSAIVAGLAQTSADWTLWLVAMICLGGNQVYFYTTDAQISRVAKTGVHDLERFSFAGAAQVDGTKLKFGLYEPYKFALAVGTSLGFAFEVIGFFAMAFWAAWAGQIWKLKKVTSGN